MSTATSFSDVTPTQVDRLVDLYMKILIKVHSLRVSCIWNEHRLVHCCVRNVCEVPCAVISI